MQHGSRSRPSPGSRLFGRWSGLCSEVVSFPCAVSPPISSRPPSSSFSPSSVLAVHASFWFVVVSLAVTSSAALPVSFGCFDFAVVLFSALLLVGFSFRFSALDLVGWSLGCCDGFVCAYARRRFACCACEGKKGPTHPRGWLGLRARFVAWCGFWIQHLLLERTPSIIFQKHNGRVYHTCRGFLRVPREGEDSTTVPRIGNTGVSHMSRFPSRGEKIRLGGHQ